jgi:hypothetical protein
MTMTVLTTTMLTTKAIHWLANGDGALWPIDRGSMSVIHPWRGLSTRSHCAGARERRVKSGPGQDSAGRARPARVSPSGVDERGAAAWQVRAESRDAIA